MECFGKIWAKLQCIILTLNLVILTNFLQKLGIYLAFFSFLRIWLILKLLMDTFGLFIFWVWQPWIMVFFVLKILLFFSYIKGQLRRAKCGHCCSNSQNFGTCWRQVLHDHMWKSRIPEHKVKTFFYFFIIKYVLWNQCQWPARDSKSVAVVNS